MIRIVTREIEMPSRSRSDRLCEFGERVRDAPMGTRVDTEFVVTAADVLNERVTTDDHSGGVVSFEATHRTESGLEPTVVAFDAVVRVLLRVVKRGGNEAFDRGS